MSDLKAEFDAAVQKVQTAEGDFKPSNDLKLEMYSLFKQASEGDVNGKKPGAFDLIGKAKWKAWEDLKGMSSDDAMQKYIDKVNELEAKLS
ncbi:acyl-coa-binding protein, acbp [gamma proteobacterium HTCC5015]|nr:acyl-coa-binding protein, acbp [gamma proteobacterium HTCC5015]